jgi:hypothetical protein
MFREAREVFPCARLLVKWSCLLLQAEISTFSLQSSTSVFLPERRFLQQKLMKTLSLIAGGEGPLSFLSAVSDDPGLIGQ